MNARIKDKIVELEAYLAELEEILPRDFEEYSTNFEKKAACERYFEKIIEAVVDLAFLAIKDARLKPPEEDKQAFDLLAEAGVISPELAERLRNAKGMRNIIAHDYGSVDDELVFHAVANELEKDVKEFIAKARRGLQKS